MKNLTTKAGILVLVLVLQITVLGCREVTKSSSMALDNANSVIGTASGKVWNGPQETKEKEKEKVIADEKRY